MDDSQVEQLNYDKFFPLINEIVEKRLELGLDITIEIEKIYKLNSLNQYDLYFDIIGNLPNSSHKQYNQFIKFVESLRIPKHILNLDVKINPYINDKFTDFQQIINAVTGEFTNFEISTSKVTLLCYYNVLKNNVGGDSYPYVSESMKFLENIQKLFDKNETLRRKVKVGTFTTNKEQSDFINKFISRKKLRNMEHFFLSEFKLVNNNDLSLGASPLIILIDKNKVIRYFGNPLYCDLEAHMENLYNGLHINNTYTDPKDSLLTKEQQSQIIIQMDKFYRESLLGQMRCFSCLTLHFKKIINEPIANLEDMRCTLVAEVDNLTYWNKIYVDKLFDHIEQNLPKNLEADLNNIYTESLDNDRTCCLCQ